MKPKKTSILFLLFIVIFTYSQAFGDEPQYEELLNEIKALKARVAGLEKRLAQQENKTVEVEEIAHGAKREFKEFIKYKPGEGVEIEAAELVIGADATFIVQGTPNANNAGVSEDSRFDGSWSSDVEIEKAFADWGLAFLHFEAGQGDTVEGELSVFSNVNRDAGDTGADVQITEIWYEHYSFNRQLILTFGKLDSTIYIDQNEYANDETTQFLGHIFRNSPTIEWSSDSNLGCRAYVCIEPLNCFEFEFGYFEGDGDWENIVDHNVYMTQMNFNPTKLFNYDADQWDGNYRFYFWVNDRWHEKLAESDMASAKTKEINYGLGLSCDQMITDVFGIFGRFGWQRPDILPADITMADVTNNPTLEWTWSTGAQMTGKYWNREDDVLAFAIGQVFPSKKWKDASLNNYGAGEGHIEAYYKCQLNQNLAISPDIQLIWNPNGVSKSIEGDYNTIFVYGVRGQVDF